MILYNIGIYLTIGWLHIYALYNNKARRLLQGRKGLFLRLSQTIYKIRPPIVWIHCSSLGEFEQATPVIESLKKRLPTHSILVSFFSSSGYDVVKTSPYIDFVTYIPWDTPSATKKFIALIQPSMALFIKYDFWLNMMQAIHDKNIPLIFVSSIFRKEQIFFQPYGYFYRTALQHCHHFFVQNEASKQLLHNISIRKITVCPDARFDRIRTLIEDKRKYDKIERFKCDKKIFIIGSCWEKDITLLVPFINKYRSQVKFIIAPHEVDSISLHRIEKKITQQDTIRYSQVESKIENYSVLIIDNIGMLSQLYKYGSFAYVGGGLERGVHNVLEVAGHGRPIFFGNKNYKKFQEVVDLIDLGVGFPIESTITLEKIYIKLSAPSAQAQYQKVCDAARLYIQNNKGGTKPVVDYCINLTKRS